MKAPKREIIHNGNCGREATEPTQAYWRMCQRCEK